MLVFDPLHLGLDCDQSVTHLKQTQIWKNVVGTTTFLEDFEQGMLCDVNDYWSTHTKPSHTRVNSPHFWSTHPIYEIKKDYSDGGMVFSTYCGTFNLSYMLCRGICLI